MSKKVYIMPAGPIGAAMYYVIKTSREEGAVIGFLDSSKGRRPDVEFCGLPVIIPDEADRSAPVIVSSYRFGEVIIKQLNDLGFKNVTKAEDFLTEENTTAVLDQMQKDEIEERYGLLSIKGELKAFFTNSQKDTDKLIIKSIDIVITEKCTLKCRDCSSLMQYYENPVDLDMKKVIESVDKLFEFCDNVCNTVIIGGEPLMVKNLAPLIDQLNQYRSKIDSLKLVTNGTLIPHDDVINAMCRADLAVNISDYGELSKKKRELGEKLKDRGVTVNIKDTIWHRESNIIDPTNTATDAEGIFSNCDVYCAQMMNGKLYYCSFISHGDALRVFPEDKDNYVDLFSSTTTKESLRAYIERQHALPACRYCSGKNRSSEPIPVAIQTEKPLPYKKHL